MRIETGRKVSLEYTVWDGDKNEIDSNIGDEPLVYVHGEGELITGLETELDGKEAGAEFDIEVLPEEAYGMPSDENIVAVPTEDVPEEARKEGAFLETTTDEGDVLSAVVAHTDDEETVLDFNHPLAGMALAFKVKVLEVSAA